MLVLLLIFDPPVHYIGYFPIFVCTEVENERYLVADMSLNCGSNEYRDGAIYAAFMVLVYPVGIPMMYLWMLYQVKNDIIAMSKSLRDGTKMIMMMLLMARSMFLHRDLLFL